MIFLSPHNDDETLFGSFLIQKFKPLVVVCLRSYKQLGSTWQDREAETYCACEQLGVGYEQWGVSDVRPEWPEVARRMRAIDRRLKPELVFAPAPMWAENEHEFDHSYPEYGALHHDFVGQLALEVFGAARVTGYTTYTRWGGRTVAVPVVPQPEWIWAKLAALACYRTQIVDAGCRPHFMGGLDEYVAA